MKYIATGTLPSNDLDSMLKSAVQAAKKSEALALAGNTKLLGHYLVVGQRRVVIIFEATEPHQFFEIMSHCQGAEWDITPILEIGKPLFEAAVKADCRNPSISTESIK